MHSIDSKEWVVVLGGAGIVGQCAIQVGIYLFLKLKSDA